MKIKKTISDNDLKESQLIAQIQPKKSEPKKKNTLFEMENQLFS